MHWSPLSLRPDYYHLRLSPGEQHLRMANTAPANPAIAKIIIKNRYSPIENPKKYIDVFHLARVRF